MNKILTITICGDDAFEFLQGQISNDLNRLESETKIQAAWCNPKGRVIWFGTVQNTAGGYAISAAAEMADAIVRRLTMFRFRSKVTFDIVDEGLEADPTALIERGYPYIGVQQSEQFTPHMLNLDLLDAISLDKGCYTGQEIVARTHYKGATKRRTMRFDSEAPVSVGDKVSSSEREIGEVLNTAGTSLLAVVAVAKTGDQLSVNGVSLDPKSLPYSLIE